MIIHNCIEVYKKNFHHSLKYADVSRILIFKNSFIDQSNSYITGDEDLNHSDKMH